MTIFRSLSRRELIAGGMAYGFLAIRRGVAAEYSSPDRSTGAVPFGQIKRIIEGLHLMGEPLSDVEAAQILALAQHPTATSGVELDQILDRYTLLRLKLDRSGVGRCSLGGASPLLAELGWRFFLVRVENPAMLTGPLSLSGSVVIPEASLVRGIHDGHILGDDVADSTCNVGAAQWMGYRFGIGALPDTGLEGASVEYQVLQLFSQREPPDPALLFLATARLPSFRTVECAGSTIKFSCTPATTVAISIRDGDGAGAMASLLIRDEAGRLYPPPAHRLEPDLGYQPEIYRADAESLRLPAGRYTVIARRGPEYLESQQDLVVPATGVPAQLTVNLQRWIDPTQNGWYPGDPHIHPEGQSFDCVSQYGLTPETLLRQVRGEALSVGSILIWTGGYYYEKQFLTGHVYEPTYRLPFPERQRENNTALTPSRTPHDAESLIRYDVEQAAFPSNRLGHPMLLQLKNHDFPGAKSIYDWPSWNLPILQWARAQGAVVGYAHGGLQMPWNSLELPNFELPTLDGLGANECFVDVTHGLVDFVAGCETHPVMELNFWYHLLNCGFRLAMVGETDFTGTRSRVGAGRTYVGLDGRPAGDVGYKAWAEGIRSGRVYFGDGRSHLIDFRANDLSLGRGPLELSKPGRVTVSAVVGARLEETPLAPDDERLERSNCYWHLERARIPGTRTVPLELVVNGRVVRRLEVVADGMLRTLSFTVDVSSSSWVALRILPSAHTSPIYISIAGRPIRASRRSAQWCLDCVEVLWSQHAKRIRESERAAAAAAWDHARSVYRRIASECGSN